MKRSQLVDRSGRLWEVWGLGFGPACANRSSTNERSTSADKLLLPAELLSWITGYAVQTNQVRLLQGLLLRIAAVRTSCGAPSLGVAI
jgi:hypothetical protein